MREKSMADVIENPDIQEAVGTFVGQVAHDLNNLMTPLLAYPDLIRDDLPEDGQARHLLDVMLKASGDIVHLSHQLLDFSMRGKLDKRSLNLNRLVEDIFESLKNNGIPEDIIVEKDIEDRAVNIEASEDQVLSAIKNLCENAIESMGGGGVLRISTRVISGDEGDGGLNPTIRLSVSDTGPGIRADLEDRIFEPFVTDKRSAERRAPGLGLSIVKRVMDQHGGMVYFSSEPGQGATFVLDFPFPDVQHGAE